MAITTKFDNVFNKFRGSIPLDYLKAHAYSVSKMNPKKSGGNSAGLFMISKGALRVFNNKFNKNYKAEELSNPALNTQIATWILHKIISYYDKRYPSLKQNWNNASYVALVAHGYNTGYSEPNGIGAAVKKIESAGGKVTLTNVARVSKVIGLGPAKYNSRTIKLAKNITNLFFVQSQKTKTDTVTISPPSPGAPEIEIPAGGPTPKLGIGLLVIGIPVAALLLTRKK